MRHGGAAWPRLSHFFAAQASLALAESVLGGSWFVLSFVACVAGVFVCCCWAPLGLWVCVVEEVAVDCAEPCHVARDSVCESEARGLCVSFARGCGVVAADVVLGAGLAR